MLAPVIHIPIQESDVRNADVTISDSTLSGNQALDASADGGAVYVDQGMVTVERSTFTMNSAGDAGGAIFGRDTTITVTDGIELLTVNEGGEQIADPHAWFSPRNAAVYVNNIVRGISQIDPANKEEYEARATLFLQQLRVLDSWIREQINRIPADRRILVTTHDAFNYFCREFKLNPNNDYLSIAPVGWSTGAEVGAGITPERRRKVVQSIKESGAPAIFVETTINPKQIREIAKETGVEIGGELYSDSMGPENSAGETYIGMMRENVILIVNALK